MISYYTIFTILLFHWIFDFHLQTDEMAKGKSKCNAALLKHVGVYGWATILITLCNYRYFNNVGVAFAYPFINNVAHFLTDWITSRASSALYKEERYHDFFVVIGADQMIHYITLFGTFVWLSNL